LRVLRDVRPLSPRLGGALLLVVVLIAYAAALRNGFIWDDDLHVTANPHIIGPLGLKEVWTTAAANYFPLVLTNFWLQHALWGLNPFGYHVVTVVLHGLAAIALWRVLVALRVPGAWCGAALWALHPVQVESVAWISELKNTQSAVFFFLSILYYLHWLDAPERRRYYAVALLCAVAAILSKPSTVMLPVALGLCAWWRRGRLEWRQVLPLAPFFGCALLASGWTIWEQRVHSGASGPEWSQSLFERAAIAGRIIWFYLGKLAWPEPLIFIYPRWKIDPANPLAYAPLLIALAAAGWLAWRARGALRPTLFGALYFGALLFPVLGFFNVYFFRYSFVGDHFQYLASVAPLVLLSAAVARHAGRAALPVAAAALVGCGVLTWRQCPVYESRETLWRDTVTHNPGAKMAWINLADTLSRAARRAEALPCYERALALDPNDADVHNDFGNDLILLGRPAEALPHLERAAELKPDWAEMQGNLGNALRAVGRGADSIEHYQRAVALAPRYAKARLNLGSALAEAGRYDDAVREFTEALRLNPNDASARQSLGLALRRLGRLPDAIAEFERALRTEPNSAELHMQLGMTLVQAGRTSEAIAQLEQATKLGPTLAAAHGALGTTLAVLQRWSDAIPVLERAIALDPANPESRRALGVALVNTNHLEQAVPHFEAALRIDPNSPESHAFLGQTLRALGRDAEAREHLRRAAELQRR
jgi:tetratricopeptide (TPR) repeat protein